ncbi:MAG: CopG family transcriptional regulator [Thermoleophilia bacterium]|nr:CopG family transcriptional regulator [Thermoleophilia bacterium]
MPRMTITLSPERQRALKEAAVRRGTTITAVIDQSLELAGIRTRESAADIVSRARARSCMSEQEAMDLALRETAEVREPTAARRASAAPRTGRR